MGKSVKKYMTNWKEYVLTLFFFDLQESKELEKELTEHVNKEVTDYKRIRGGIIFRKEMPRNSVGKLVRKRMRDWAKEQK